MAFQDQFEVLTRGRGSVDITPQVALAIHSSGITTGIAHVFTLHSSCGLAITESADAMVRADLETLMERWAPDGDPAYHHTTEGRDDMAAHARSVLTGVSLTIPVGERAPLLGIWQGIYLFEHRKQSHRRQIVVTVLG